ncbi:phage tail sheath family protein [Chryseobacterium echinoideorum]|uniref:phage tail sheath family protein n=1 Tax=Chryseobacterium echinoideorum TaxID=1549648 RepID=UPI001184B132|nr:phage tail sheath C-terminal domain-containing protein [Chryseobacterium echinoideorum]
MNYKAPGVYVEEITKFPPSVAQVETAIPAFIGYTAEGPKNEPTRISSMLEYEAIFGKAKSETFAVAFKDGVATAIQPNVSNFKMYYAMQMFFANGGGPCYIVSVGNYNDTVTVGSPTAVGTLSYGLDLLKKEDEPTLIVFPDLQDLVATADDVAAANVAKNAAQQAVVIADEAVDAAIDAVSEAASGSSEEQAQAAQNLADAEADADTAEKILDAAEASLISVTAAATFETATTVYSLYQSALDQAELLKDRFVIMDVLGSTDIFESAEINNNLKYGAAYYPNLKTILSYNFKDADVFVTGVSGATTLAELKSISSELYNKAKQAIEAKQVVLAPSSSMAGVYAKVDSTSGVWKAPANIGLNYVVAPMVKVSDRQQDLLNVNPNTGKSINAIRNFTGKGNLVWGARTLDGNSNEWRYISVRRFFNMVEESVKKATERFVFEPNTANTWIRVQTMIENFLNQQWQDGALAGSRPEEAYYVSVGLNKTMSPEDVLEGRMIIEIGMAAVRPAEFIVLRFSHKLQEA